jgi:beta-galactosidase/beta-glucuronidase
MYSKKSSLRPLAFVFLFLGLIGLSVFGSPSAPDLQPLSSGWELQDAAKVTATPEQVSQVAFQTTDWYPATVPGTVLTTLVHNKVYPEPLYGENNRPDKIPESLCHTSYWYRTSFSVPATAPGRSIWLNFDGINYSADVWVNGANAGSIKGAFARGTFDITRHVKPGATATLAVLVHPQPNPGVPIEHNLEVGSGRSGGIATVDGPTFLCALGWDWMPGIRDRDTGIWQKVYLSTTGPVRIDEPFVTSDLPLPRTDSADIKVQVTLKNGSDQPQKGTLKGTIGENPTAPDYAAFQQSVEVPAHSSKVVILDPSTTPALRLKNPKLWWPNGYGAPNLYPVHLSFDTDGGLSDSTSFKIGIRKIAYAAEGSDNLAISVNGVRVVCKGGDWGLDEALKRIPRERLEAQLRYHQQANYTIIRNWVGQSTEEDLYDLCDQYGILLWDEFFQPNPGNGPNPTDLDTYMANAREKIVRFRNHPSIVVRCGRNEGRPPEMIDDALTKLMTELDPNCLYQPSSTYGRGVHSGGPYYWQPPEAYYRVDCAFKTEIGSISIPTLEAVQAMMPKKDWETINDDWAEHDLTKGNQEGDTYPGELNRRYGKALNLADFVRKAQLANYESFRAMYEGRFAQLFKPVTGVITWMSNPAQPSFVWQIYSWDLEPNAAFFATRKACEPIHIMLNEANGHLQVINNPPTAFDGTATVTIYNSDGTVASHQDLPAHAAGSAATDLGLVEQPDATAHLRFVKLDLRDATGAIVSDNFYWRAGTEPRNDLQALRSLPIVKLEASVKRRDAAEKSFFDVTLRNPSKNLVLMSHLQLRRGDSGERVLPIYYSDNYVSMVPQESKTLSIEVATADLHGQKPLLVLDGWNVDVAPVSSTDCDVALNKNALVASWPVTGIPIKWFNGPLSQVKIACGQRYGVKDFSLDTGYDTGIEHRNNAVPVDLSAEPSLSQDLFKVARVGECTYTFPMKPAAGGYTVKLIFAERDFGPKPPPKNKSTPAASEPETPRPEINRIGKRIFNVAINDETVLKNFDICVAAGKWDKAVVEEFKGIQPDKDGNILIRFQNGPASQPLINAIEVLPSEK